MVLSCSKKKLSALLRGIRSKNDGNFYCLNCLQSFARENKRKDFCNVAMPSEDTKTLEFNQYQKSDKALFVVQLMFNIKECLI